MYTYVDGWQEDYTNKHTNIHTHWRFPDTAYTNSSHKNHHSLVHPVNNKLYIFLGSLECFNSRRVYCVSRWREERDDLMTRVAYIDSKTSKMCLFHVLLLGLLHAQMSLLHIHLLLLEFPLG